METKALKDSVVSAEEVILFKKSIKCFENEMNSLKKESDNESGINLSKLQKEIQKEVKKEVFIEIKKNSKYKKKRNSYQLLFLYFKL